MCGRYTLHSNSKKLAKQFSASPNYRFDKSYNIAPTTMIPVVVALDNERLIVPMRWGLIPSWHKEGQKLAVLNNAKIETIDTKPAFRASFRRHRCLILADGFFEWDAKKTPKQPFYFHRDDNEPFAMAGIWERWVSDDKAIDSCCIITMAANEVVSKVHDRMPAIISADQYDDWLDNELHDVSALKQITDNESSYNGFECYPVTTKMNRVMFNNEDCIKRI